MFKHFAAAALLAGLAAPAAAVSYDAFTSFDATQGAGNFTYGSFDGSSFTLFTNTGPCVITGTVCLQDPALPGSYKSTVAGTFGTVIVPDDRLILHPGEFDASVFVAFTASEAGTYNFSALFSDQDSSTTEGNVGITEFTTLGGVSSFAFVTTVGNSQPSLLTGGTVRLAAGDAVGYILDKQGVYFNDSTGVSLAVANVPEPATWAMMIAGFGLVGVGLRRRGALAA